MKCPNCGLEIPVQAVECPKCEKTALLETEEPTNTEITKRKPKYKLLPTLNKKTAAAENEKPHGRVRLNTSDIHTDTSWRPPTTTENEKNTLIVSYLICPPFPPFRLEKGKTFKIGRDKSNQVVLPSRDVSRFHGNIQWEDGAYVLKDLDSANGTFVNEDYIERHVCENGDKIFIGTHTIIYREILVGVMPSADIPDASLQDTLRISVKPLPAEITQAGSKTFSGDIASIGLLSILQMLGMERKSGCLKLSMAKATAEIYLLEGTVLHCVYGEMVGRDAFFAIAGWREGKFEFCPTESSLEVTMSDEIQWLLLEAMRLLDEQGKV